MENISKVIILIFFIISIYIEPIKLLQVGLPNAKYNLEEKLCERYTNADQGDKGEIKEVMATDNNEDDDKDFQDITSRLMKKKQQLKRVTIKARTCQQSNQDNDKTAAGFFHLSTSSGFFIAS